MYKFISSLTSSGSDAIPDSKSSNSLCFFPRAHSILSRLPKLPLPELNDHKGYIKSNDPAVTGLERYRVSEGEHLMLVASTSLNPIAVACELAVNNKKRIIPQVVLIDDSKNASKIWKALCNLFKDNNSTQFSSKLKSFLETHYTLLTNYTDSLQLETFRSYTIEYVNEVIQKYQYDFVKAVVLQTVYLEQKWEDKSTFDCIKNFIDLSACKNIFVYPSNIVTLCNEYIGRQICQNIHKLNPRLTIHVNLNMDLRRPTEILFLEGESQNSPDVALERITAAIRFDDTPFAQIIGMAIYSFTPKNYKMFTWQIMHKAITRMIQDNQYDFNQYSTPFLLDIILRLVGIDMNIDYYFQDIAEYNAVTVFHVKTPYDEMKAAIKILREKFPDLDARFCLLGQAPAKPALPTRITLDIAGITKAIIPLIPPYLRANPDVRLQYETSHSVQHRISDLFKNYHMSTSNSDCFEETLCLLVKKKLKSKGIEAEELVTTSSLYQPDPNRPNHTNILVTTPVHVAKHISDYFNEIAKDTASVEEKQEWVADKNTYMTKIIVVNSTLLSKQCLDDLKFAVENLVSKEATEDYWRQAGYIPPFDTYRTMRM
jgi:hypothetical protein